MGREPVVICYHAVHETWPHRLALPREQLLSQVRVGLRLRGGVHATFDDAYRNIGSILPELLAMGVAVTVFACTGFADRGGAPLTVPELASDDPEDLDGLTTMTWDELRALAGDGIAIGSHTVSHPHLPRLADDELARELRDSKARVEEEMGRPCPTLAYPYGDHDARVRAAARAAGYERAYALKARPGDPWESPRVDLYRRDTPLRAALKFSPLYVPAARVLERFRS